MAGNRSAAGARPGPLPFVGQPICRGSPAASGRSCSRLCCTQATPFGGWSSAHSDVGSAAPRGGDHGRQQAMGEGARPSAAQRVLRRLCGQHGTAGWSPRVGHQPPDRVRLLDRELGATIRGRRHPARRRGRTDSSKPPKGVRPGRASAMVRPTGPSPASGAGADRAGGALHVPNDRLACLCALITVVGLKSLTPHGDLRPIRPQGSSIRTAPPKTPFGGTCMSRTCRTLTCSLEPRPRSNTATFSSGSSRTRGSRL